MKTQHTTLSDDVIDVWSSVTAFLGISKIYLIILGGMAWIFSTYDVKGILVLFSILTLLDTLTRIHADSTKKGIPFNPLLRVFWLQIKSSGLKLMGRKVFVEYGIAVLIAFAIDINLFKSALNFNLLSLKLNIPMCSILFFTGIELWSIFENLEDAGYTNWLKKGTNLVSDFLPEKWKSFFEKLKSNKNE